MSEKQPDPHEMWKPGTAPAPRERADAGASFSIIRLVAAICGALAWALFVVRLNNGGSIGSLFDRAGTLALAPSLAWCAGQIAGAVLARRWLATLGTLLIGPAAWSAHYLLFGLAGDSALEGETGAAVAALLSLAWVTYGLWRYRALAAEEADPDWESSGPDPGRAILKTIGLMEIFILVVLLASFSGIFSTHDYTPRARVSELILAGSSAKTSLAEGMQQYGSWSPEWMSSITISATGMVKSASIGPTGVITVTGTAPTSNAIVTMTPTITTDNKLVWTCVGTPAKYMPASCRPM